MLAEPESGYRVATCIQNVNESSARSHADRIEAARWGGIDQFETPCIPDREGGDRIRARVNRDQARPALGQGDGALRTQSSPSALIARWVGDHSCSEAEPFGDCEHGVAGRHIAERVQGGCSPPVTVGRQGRYSACNAERHRQREASRKVCDYMQSRQSFHGRLTSWCELPGANAALSRRLAGP